MAQLPAYDPEAKPSDERSILPPGEYEAVIIDSTVKSNSKNTGDILSLKWQIISGQHEGNIVFQSINVTHDNQKAAEIGQRELASVRHATGKLNAKDSSEFHDIPCVLKLKIRPANDKYGESNEVAGIRSAKKTATTTTSAPAPAPAARKPWERKTA